MRAGALKQRIIIQNISSSSRNEYGEVVPTWMNYAPILGTEQVIDGVFAVAGLTNWTLGAGWADGTGKAAKNANGVGTLTPVVAIPAVIGTVYKIAYKVLDVTVDGVTLTYGGVSDTTRLADGTYTAYITATTTGSLILTPSSNGSRFSIDNTSIKVYPTYVWARVEPLSGRELFQAQQIQASINTRFTIRHITGITPKMRISYDSKNYQIESVINTNEQNREIQLMCSIMST